MGLFNKQENSTSIFASQEEENKPSALPESREQMKAQAAIVSDGDDLANFNQIAIKGDKNSEKEADQRLSTKRAQDNLDQQQVGIDIISDPSVPEETRLSVAQTLQQEPENKSSVKLVAEELSDRNEEGREFISDVFNGYIELVEEKEKLVNQHFSMKDQSGWETFADVVQFLLPLDEQVELQSAIRKTEGTEGATGTLEALLLLGESKIDLQKLYQEGDIDTRKKLMNSFAQALKDSRGLLVTNDNTMRDLDTFLTMVEGEEYYSTGSRILDNATSVAEAIGLGLLFTPASAVAKGAKATKAIANASKLARRLSVSKVRPTSVAKIAEEVNPEEARKLQALAIADESGEIAGTTHGATRDDVIADVDLPQPNVDDGSIEAKVRQDKERIDDLLAEVDTQQYTADEILQAQNAAVNTFDGIGLTKNDSMSTSPVNNSDGSVTFNNVYQKGDRGWKTPADAMAAVQRQLNEYDLDNVEFEILQKRGTGYEPTTEAEILGLQEARKAAQKSRKALPEELKKVNQQDDFAVRAKFTRGFDPAKVDVANADRSYAMTFFNRFPLLRAKRAGDSSLQRNLLDPASVLPKNMFLSANVAVDNTNAIEKVLVDRANGFVSKYSKLSPEKQAIIFGVIKKQNKLERRLTKSEIPELVADEAMDVLDEWQATWDVVYELENADVIRTAKRGNWKYFIDESSDTQVLGKPLDYPLSTKIKRAFDPRSGENVRLDKDTIKDLYDKGYDLVELRSPEGKVTHMINRNDATAYTRELRKTDRILNKKEGYYSVRYKDPYFIKKVVTASDGSEEVMVLRTAGNRQDADQLVKEFSDAETEANVRYIRNDDRNAERADIIEEDSFQASVNQGRTTQRIRGERVGSYNKGNTDLDGALQDPAESLLSSVRSASRRTSMRNWLDNQKDLFLKEFADVVPKKNGLPYFPENSDELAANKVGSNYDKRMADANTAWEYITSLEHGYRSSIDDLWKSALNGIAHTIGAKSQGAERAIRALAEEVPSPTGFMRGRAFDAYLATNPLRQFVVQGHQSILLLSNFTKYASFGLSRDMAAIHLAMVHGDDVKKMKGMSKVLGISPEDAVQLRREWDATGFEGSIDRNNLIEVGIEDIVESTRFKNTRKAHKAVVGNLRKVGFDVGERINLMSSWLAHRNKALEEGKNVTAPEVRGEIKALARNFTFNMNAAGEMPYNKNALSLIFQFMQVPHKAMLTGLTNKALSRNDKAKLMAFNMIVLPTPPIIAYNIVASLGLDDDDPSAEIIRNGVEGFLINHTARTIMGDDTNIDLSSLSAIDPYGLYELIFSAGNTGIADMVANSPSMSLLMGNNPKIAAAYDEVSRLLKEPSDEQLLTSINTFLNISSGYANFSKAYKEAFMDNLTYRLSSSGRVTAEGVTILETVAKAFGMPTTEETYDRIAKTKSWEESSAARKDVQDQYKMDKMHLVRAGVEVGSQEFVEALYGDGNPFWIAGNTPELQMVYMNEMKKDINAQDSRMVDYLLKSAGFVSYSSFEAAVKNSSLPDDAKEDLLTMNEDLANEQ